MKSFGCNAIAVGNNCRLLISVWPERPALTVVVVAAVVPQSKGHNGANVSRLEIEEHAEVQTS